MIGKRFDLSIPFRIDCSAKWGKVLLDVIGDKKAIHQGIVCFVFPKGLYTEIPAFAIGRPFFDNWLVWYANAQDVPTANLTELFRAIHSEHDYSHQPKGQKWVLEATEAERNFRSLVGWQQMHSVRDTRYRLTAVSGFRVRRRLNRVADRSLCDYGR